MLPIVSDVLVMLVLPQATEVSDPQVLARICIRTLDGADETVIVCVEATATNLYHTSNLSDAPHPIVEIVEGFQVAFTLVPPVFTQLVEEFRTMALEHSSLLGIWLKDGNDVISPSNRRTVIG